jgi:hypothetical protein
VKLNRANGVRAKHVAEDAKAAANKKKWINFLQYSNISIIKANY